MKRSKTSKAWMREHVNDPFVQKAKQEGYRSRAAYKLMEIDKRDHLLAPGMVVVDLGAAPGSWAQVAADKVGSKGKVIAVDLLEIHPMAGVTFIQGDFTEESVLEKLVSALNRQEVDVVLSDMAPNISGIGLSDQARSIYLAELALDFASKYLKPNGSFLVKVFQGSGFQEFVTQMRQHFKIVITRKPEASRSRSNEVYLLGMDLKT